jgi:hypothetical protein
VRFASRGEGRNGAAARAEPKTSARASRFQRVSRCDGLAWPRAERMTRFELGI